MPLTDKVNGTPEIAYRPDIDGLRAVAILCVVLFHAYPGLLSGGFIGVDIFFVISGYLISGIIFAELNQGHFKFLTFYQRRIRRIFPALITVITCTYIYGWVSLLPAEFKHLGKHIAGGSGFVENLLLWQEAGYFDSTTEAKPLMHLWSLSIEEQYYLAFPLLIYALHRLSAPIRPVILTLTLSSLAISALMLAEDPTGTFFLPHTRMWELLSGALLAAAVPKSKRQVQAVQIQAPPSLTALLGASLIAIAATQFSGNTPFPGLAATLPVIGTLLLIHAGPQALPNRLLLSSKPVIFIGLISYPLYLWHWPIISYLHITEASQPEHVTMLIALCICVALAYLTYRYIEKPIRSGDTTTLQSITLSMLSLCIGTIGYQTYANNGFKDRLAAQRSLTEQLSWGESDNFSPLCRNYIGINDMGYCLGDPRQAPNAVLIGDSHANSLFPGLEWAFNQVGKSLLNLGGPGCPPFYDTDSYVVGEEKKANRCREWTRYALDYALQSPSVETIILAGYANRYIHGDIMGIPNALKIIPRYKNLIDIPPHKVFETTLYATLEKLTNSKKEIIFVIDWPEPGFNPISCFDARPFRIKEFRKPSCTISLEKTKRRTEKYREIIQLTQNDFPSVKWFDTPKVFCNAETCQLTAQGRLLYRDHNHLSRNGSMHVGNVFKDELLSLSRR